MLIGVNNLRVVERIDLQLKESFRYLVKGLDISQVTDTKTKISSFTLENL